MNDQSIARLSTIGETLGFSSADLARMFLVDESELAAWVSG